MKALKCIFSHLSCCLSKVNRSRMCDMLVYACLMPDIFSLDVECDSPPNLVWNVSDNNLNKVELAPDDIARFEQVFDQQEFKDYYYETLENVKNNNDLNNISDCPENVKKALVNYLELFNEYPENVDELVEIANGYIDIIEKNNEFSKDEKDMIYAAIMVSVYSPQLWYNFK